MPKDSVDIVNKRTRLHRRKPTIWTREKISKLIELYRESDCLWNHYSAKYKNKDCRAKAIEYICESLGITKIDYGKKVHNLRNQFNSELKKLERRLEESGSSSPTVEKTCRWEHFNTLMFLRSVIEPRPGYQQTPQSQCKKMINKLDYRITAKEEEPVPSSIENLESIVFKSASEPIPAESSQSTSFRPPSASRLAIMDTTAVSTPVQIPTTSRDQWDAFGELIANEFRNLNSDIFRKRLKRKIMQVMLEIGEEDDLEYTRKNS
ncbi:uncharacterized protein Dana_GF12047, isoform A [Drosophila ananassae]|uniref:Uncharacterized protein, isoform A n=1 Tax=Drosophila ananassae TaxID=7217 RepID=B3MCP1_DROAN|nr:uncharacterized protein LOC6494905 isoform X1 [Drosophila ananassae]EDV36275.1 uncharacterized protein Dana_GF12047, isoform A [Drosophila ananassae]